MDVTSDLILTTEQIAKKLSLTMRHTRELFKDGTLPAFRRGKRVWGVSLLDFQRWLKSREQKAETES